MLSSGLCLYFQNVDISGFSVLLVPTCTYSRYISLLLKFIASWTIWPAYSLVSDESQDDPDDCEHSHVRGTGQYLVVDPQPIVTPLAVFRPVQLQRLASVEDDIST